MSTHPMRQPWPRLLSHKPERASRSVNVVPDRKRLSLTHPIEVMPTIARIGTHMGRPAAGLNRFGPFTTDEDVRTIDFIDRAVDRPFVGDRLLRTANTESKRLPLQTRDGVHAGDL